MESLFLRDTSTPMFIAALFTIAKIQEQAKSPSTVKWIKMFITININYLS